MASFKSKISTIVRLKTLRAGFRLGSFLRPEATLRRARELFCTPFASTRARALRTPNGAAVEADVDVIAEHIHTYVWGDPRAQPYVLLAHGWSSHGTRFLRWVERLRSAGYAVVAFDQTAHGRSSGRLATLPQFAEVLFAVGQRFGPAAAVIAHSLGGAAAAVAMARGLQAQRAVLIAPAADPEAAVGRFARVVGLPARLIKRMIAGFETLAGMSFADLQAQRIAPQIGRPALIIHDINDREVPWAEGERYARYWPDSRLLSTTGLGHNRIVDDASVIDAAMRFLQGEPVGERVVSSPNLPYGFA